MKNRYCLLLLTVCTIFSTCGIFIPDNGENTALDNPDIMVAMIATLDETDVNDDHYNQILLVDINNPKEYKFIGEKTSRISFLSMSGDGTKLAYIKGEHHSQQEIMIYDIRADNLYSIDIIGNEQSVKSNFTRIKWDFNNTGVYYNKGTFYIYSHDENSIKYYNLNSRKISTIIDRGPVYINSLIDKNHFLGWSKESLLPNSYAGFYVVSITGNVISKINNPLLKPIPSPNMMNYYFPVNWLDWNLDKRLFTGRLSENDNIVIFNLEGGYYREYDTGHSRNFPIWSRNGKEIIVECEYSSSPSSSYLNRKIVLLDPKTGEIREFLSPEDIEGVNNLSLYLPIEN